MARATFLEAIRQAQYDEMRRDDRVFIMGEDIVCSVFGTTLGFAAAFGRERARDPQISENGLIAPAPGAALLAMRPLAAATLAHFLYPSLAQGIDIALGGT